MLLALSGGIDSIFLYYILKEISIKHNFIISIAHVNYNSNENSQDAMNLCLELAQKYKHTFYVRNNCFLNKKNYESKAREVRYDFFGNILEVEGYDYILTAHHKNDLLETLYMQKKNKNDISIIPFSNINNKILRPLLNVDRKTIKEYILEKKYTYVEDLTNLDTRLKRNHIRLKVFPSCENINLIEKELLEIYKSKNKKMKLFKKTLNKYLKYISFDNHLNKIKIDKAIFASLDLYVMKLIFQTSINRYMDVKIKKTEKYWKNLYKKIESKKKQFSDDLSPQLKIFSDNQYIYIYKKSNFIKAEDLKNGTVWLNGAFEISKEKIGINKSNDKNIFLYPKILFEKGLTIRRWFYGDKFDLPNGKKKKVSDLFNDNKINIISKNEHPIILNHDRIEWIPGLAHSKNNYKEYEELYTIKWVRNE